MSKICRGCGITLQSVDVNQDGYVSRDNHELCERCFRITNYNENKVVSKDNNDYLKILDTIKDDDLVIYVASLLTLNLEYLNRFKNVILVLTKRDIIPKSVKNGKIISYIKKKYLNILDIVVVSAYKNQQMDELYNLIEQYGNKKMIYVVGTTNSGKSTLINSLMKSHGNTEMKITTSAYPSTTLGVIPVKLNNLEIYDTPGLVVEKSIINYLNNNDLKKINSKKEIKPVTFQLKGLGSIIIDNYLRIDYETDGSSMTVYAANSLNIRSVSLKNDVNKFDKYFCIDNVVDKDIVIEDIGFLKFTNLVNVKIYYKNDIEIRVRDNLI